jgi:hypothetical protein
MSTNPPIVKTAVKCSRLSKSTRDHTEELRHFYDEAAAQYPEYYRDHSFELWLVFLRSRLLVAEHGDKFQITVRGQELLKYLV